MFGTIEHIFENTSKSGRVYLTVVVSGRKGGVFSQKDIAEVKSAGIGAYVSYEEESTPKGYVNFKDFKKVTQQEATMINQQQQQQQQQPNERSVTMLVSYAKDLVVSGKSKEEAVEIVKYLVDSFRSVKI